MNAPERRREVRVPVALTAQCELAGEESFERLANCSRGGFYLLTRASAFVGCEVTARVSLPQPEGMRICTLLGVVARVDRDGAGQVCGVAVRLRAHQMSGADLGMVATFIEMCGFESHALGVA